MSITVRNYQQEEDYWRLRAFLRQGFTLNQRRELCWPAARLDYWRWHLVMTCDVYQQINDGLWFWEDQNGELAGALIGEEVVGYLQMHPQARTPELAAEMLAEAEKHLVSTGQDGKQRVLIGSVFQDDEFLCAALTDAGYKVVDNPNTKGYIHVCSLVEPLPEVYVPEGYTIRAMRGEVDFPARSWCSWKAFHPDDPDEDYEGWNWLYNFRSNPLYRRDLDIIAEAPDGEIAAFATLWYDDATRFGLFTPVGTHPDHQKMGLGRAVMTEAMRRMRRMGALSASVEAYEPDVSTFYSKVMGSEAEIHDLWVKRL